ncbi:proteasome regulatory particle subunit RPN11 [Cymbomonas tetramitiformis]|uniref:Proteasome regulatory particle subunit RPN11 n=1 Tax=Cymbomonas tetramitiformis TaxID=36881 RepID=A0AAE0BZX8_9CHLO|nr:proteasome regulatory particle subunit RPN11 [Cymbomonas tetramitiformis]|eukprot:gene4420-5429_t
MAGTSSSNAMERWILENNIQSVDPEVDAIFKLDEVQQSDIAAQKPWTKNPHHFKHVRVSALALLKMAMHCRSGGNIEVMGMMLGKVIDDTFCVMDAFPLPVEGTETRVNAQAEAYEYMVQFVQEAKSVGRLENVVGWYHSHPGYGCWMSGIDCSTQMLNQQFTEPFLAIVIDPIRTVAAGKVEIGAFRTYPEGYKPQDEAPSEYQTIPLSKIEDFGVHAKQYYSLDISFFKSSLDSNILSLLWNKYWVNTLSSSPLLGNREFVAGQISDLAEKLEQAEGQLAHSGRVGSFFLPSEKKKEESQLTKISHDSTKTTVEQVKGIASQVIKDLLFNYRPHLAPSGAIEPMQL